jgi:tetratricopeptide (TPR) repeat protein
MIHRFLTKTSLILLLLLICGVAGLKAQTLDEAITATNNERYDKADQILQDLAKKSPSSKIYYLLGENTLLDFFSDTISNSLKVMSAEAKQQFEKGIALNASDPFNYIGLAKVAAYLGDQQTASQMRAKAKSFLLPYKKVTKIPNASDYALTLAKLAESYIVFDNVDTTAALPLVREALTIDGKNSSIYIIAGDIYILVNNGSMAIKNYNRAQDCDPQSPIANMKIGNIYFKGKNLMAAIPYFEQAIALNKNYAPAYRELGQLYSMARKFNESKSNFETYLSLTNQNIPAKIRYVNALFYSKNYAEVIKQVEDILAVDKSRAYLNRLAGYSNFELGNYPEALKYMDKLFAQLPTDRILKKDYIYYARIIVKKNDGYQKLLGDLDKANAELAKVKDKNEALKGTTKEKEKVAEEPYAAKVAEIQKQIDASSKELPKAYEAYEKAITFDKEDLNLNLIQEKSTNLYQHRHYPEAADNWRRLIARGRNSDDNYLQIGRAYTLGKEYDKAEQTFKELQAKSPNNIAAYLWDANNAVSKDPDSKLGIAKEKFKALLAKAATDSVKYAESVFDALRFLGAEAINSKKYDEAKAYYTRMVNLAPDNKDFQVKAYSSMYYLYYTMGDYGKALECNNKILAIDPENAQAKSNTQYIQSIQAGAKPKANPNEITGVIKDSKGSPIAGASVRVKNTAAEQWTNAKGEYKFTMPENSTMLLISASGYVSKEVPVTKSRVYNATLSK